jgi:hypothetical protein
MPQINTPHSGHVAPPPKSGYSWLPYTKQRHLATLQQAIRIIDSRVENSHSCNLAFQALPGGRSFAQVWRDPNIWISYDPKADGTSYGATDYVGGKEITITEFTLRMGVWTTAGTLIHELAHTNGADGVSHDAEGTLKKCLLQTVEDPTILGMVRPLLSSGGTLV